MIVALRLSLILVAASSADQIAATVQSLNADLLSHDSATATLARWCGDRHLADPPTIRAIRVRGPDRPADASVRALLGAGPGTLVRYRHVQLTCGAHTLSDADNWYLPARLTADMNRKLDETDTPFGAIVAPLAFHRRTLEARVLLDALRAGPVPRFVLRHRALLTTGAGVPFSVVVERYTRDVLN
jgi:hypothetical protein